MVLFGVVGLVFVSFFFICGVSYCIRCYLCVLLICLFGYSLLYWLLYLFALCWILSCCCFVLIVDVCCLVIVLLVTVFLIF